MAESGGDQYRSSPSGQKLIAVTARFLSQFSPSLRARIAQVFIYVALPISGILRIKSSPFILRRYSSYQ